MKTIDELYSVCEKYKGKDVYVVVNGKKEPIWYHYIQDGTCYFFPPDVAGENCTDGSDEFCSFVENEAQDECWYNYRTGSEFFDCDFMYVNNRDCQDPDETNEEDIHEIYGIEVTDKEILLITEKPDLPTFTVSYAVRGYFDVTVQARCLEEAKELAEQIELETEFSNLIDPVAELIDAYEGE